MLGLVVIARAAYGVYLRAIRIEAMPVVRAPIVLVAQMDRIDRSRAELEALRYRARAAVVTTARSASTIVRIFLALGTLLNGLSDFAELVPSLRRRRGN